MKRGAGGLRIARPLLVGLLLAPRAAASPMERALARARAQRLWEDAQWRRLGHWRRTLPFGRPLSDAATDFFLAPDGASDPRAELEAMTAALFAPAPGGGARHPRCRFPARAAWLESRLGVAAGDLPPADCSAFEAWRRLMDAGSVSLVFASSYLNNPSSMFGHTFLRLERRATGPGQRLRDNTLNFAADTGPDGGVAFAAKGLLGLYPGRFTAMPYYLKIQEYGHIENRDLWEYRLALSSAEVDRLVAHAWEMGAAEFPYYFLSRNCSYQLLPALEAAAPRLDLSTPSRLIVSPADTLRAVRGVPGLVVSVEYRPSHATTMDRRLALMAPAERRAAKAYAAGRWEDGDRWSAGLAPPRRALVLDGAEDYVLYKKGFSPDVAADVRERERAILLRRAREADPPAALAPPYWAAPPDDGHPRRRLMVGTGARAGGTFSEIAWRPGYHDLLDRPVGYLPGAAIEGLSWRLRYDRDERRLYVRDLRLAEILSAAPWDSWTRPPSWSAGTGLDTAFERGRPAPDAQVYEGHAGAGLSWRAADRALLFALLQAESAAGPVLRGGWTVGGAARAGLALDLGARVRLLLDGALSARPLGDRTPNHRLRAGLNWSAGPGWALRAEGLLRGPYREAGGYALLYR